MKKNKLKELIVDNNDIKLDWRKPNKYLKQDAAEQGVDLSMRSIIYLRDKYYPDIHHASTALQYALMLKREADSRYRIIGKTLRQVKVELEPYMPNSAKVTLAKVKKLFEQEGVKPVPNRSGPVGKAAAQERWE